MAPIASLLAVVGTIAVALCSAVNSDYGLCRGTSPDSRVGADGRVSPDAPLADWLHDVIQDIAGRRADDSPLTFDDLERAPESPRATLGAGGADAQKGIALQMYSANVTHGRPYRFPLTEDERLYFRPCDLRKVVPASVVDYLVGLCEARPEDRWSGDAALSVEQARWPLPRGQLPIIVAARMSVSFPVLFTAVRLWAPHGRPDAELHPCLFMDGGLCSNFPIHLFDSALPAWPTFGVSLHDSAHHRDREPPLPGQPRNVYLPQSDCDGKADGWVDFDRAPKWWARLAGLAGAMLSTTKDWNDATSARLPGVWDRVVRVELESTEGGLNISMGQEVIERLSRYGTEAGRELIERFSRADATNGFATGWNEHRWVRLTRLRAALAGHLDGVGWSLAPGRHAEPMLAQIKRAIDTPPRIGETALSAAQAAALEQLLGAMVQAERALNATDPPLPKPPDPRPELRQRAPL